MTARGDYIGGRFHEPAGEPFSSHDPARDAQPVLSTSGSPQRAAEASAAAAEAAPAWRDLGMDGRLEVMHRFRSALGDRAEGLSEAITREMGKIRSEARVEIKALVNRFDLVERQVRADLASGALPGFPNESVRYAPHGVVGVLGPFNFPLHLCHAHVVPALLLGNAVVVKPSEVTPLAGERYAEAADAAGFPPGVLNVVQGGGAVGAAIGAHPEVRGLAFTGSWGTGRRIAEAALDRPEMLLALEMGGKNTCIVLEDADLRQAAHEIIIGGYLTTGQRCTCTDRVLVHRSRANALVDALRSILALLRFGDPEDPGSFAGPLATMRSRAAFLEAVGRARQAGADAVVEGGARPGGAFLAPSLHRLPDGQHFIAGYTDEELFGPDLSIETIEDDAEAIAVLEASPYGFAHSVFTQDEARFDRYRREVRCGILNRNRGTNMASPRLPFGGVKQSGNFRPAGAHAARNMVFPVATLTNPGQGINTNPKVAALLPPPDLDRLEAQHEAEERAEAARRLDEQPRAMKTKLPAGGHLPRSAALLERFYAGSRFVRHKKPLVFDHLRSKGPWMVSVDDEPLSVLDGMSQTATLPAGFSPDVVERAYEDGVFGETVVTPADSTLGDSAAVNDFADRLRALAPGFSTVSFANSGAEANEKAMALCHAATPEGCDKLLAFEGSFHGRTLLALYASHNPAKREPFQIAGYEVAFAPFPRWDAPGDEPGDPDGWRELLGAGDVGGLVARYGESGDALLRAEVASLAAVGEHLSDGGYFAVNIEPMQSEGGDNYATARFHRGLRLLTRAHGVHLIMDEVQTGFGLGGGLLWHRRFGLVDRHGQTDRPDAVCFAKRAQLGVVLSNLPDPEPTNAFPASALRGRLHADMVGLGEAACRIEGWVRPRLEALHRQWSHRIENPRATGFALAFDVADTQTMMRYLGQRFWRGAVVFGAGSRTVRYRLNASFTEADIERLFETMRRSLAWLEAHPGKSPPAWDDEPKAARDERRYAVRVVEDPAEVEAWLPKIRALEAEVYEPARRDPEEKLRLAFEMGGVAVIATGEGDQLIGSALACPLEAVAEVPGPEGDPNLGRGNTLYSLAITVHPGWRGCGVGARLKAMQLTGARAVRNADGAPRYLFLTARNRLPEASTMSRLADAYGATTVAVLDGQYGGEAQARYYRQPVGPRVVSPDARLAATPDDGDLAQGIARPFAEPPASLKARAEDGSLAGPAITKITVLNYITPAVVRAGEWLASLAPEQPHLYLCSGRDETVDKTVRLLRWHRKEARVVLSFEGAYVGHTTACARSISDPATHLGGRPYFREWPRLPHPEEVGTEATIVALREAVAAAGGPDEVFGLFVEPVQERTGRVVPDEFWGALSTLRSELGLPVVTVETAGAYHRSGRGPFATSDRFDPDVRIWWTGGHLGVLHVVGPLHVAKPLTLVSTWDGDELSLVQAHHQLRAARSVDVESAGAALDRALAPAEEAGFALRGVGLYRVLAGDGADRLGERLAEAGVRVRRYPGGHLALAPSLDRAEAQAARLAEALPGALR